MIASVDVQLSYFRLLRSKRFKSVSVNWVMDAMDLYYTTNSLLNHASLLVIRKEVNLILKDVLTKDCMRIERSRIVQSLWTSSDPRQLCDILNSLSNSELAKAWTNSSEEDLGIHLFCKLLGDSKDEGVVISVLSLWSILALNTSSNEMLLGDDISFQMITESLNSSSKYVSNTAFNLLILMSLGVSVKQSASNIIKRVEFIAVILSICASDIRPEQTGQVFGKILEIVRFDDSNIAIIYGIKRYHRQLLLYASELSNDSEAYKAALTVLSLCALRKCKKAVSILFLKEIALLANTIDVRGFTLICDFLRALLVEIQKTYIVSMPGDGVIVDTFVFAEYILFYGFTGLKSPKSSSTDVFAQVSYPFDSSPELARELCETIEVCLGSKSFQQVCKILI